MYLLIDQGNSRCKYLLTDRLGSLNKIQKDVGVWDNHSFDDDIWREYLSHLKKHDITQVLVSSVASQERKAWFKNLCEKVLKVTPCFASAERSYKSPHTDKVLTNSYQTPQALGVDRWLAMIAVFERLKGSFVVIDAGTAITTDWVDEFGQHQGGHIVAGSGLLQQALLGNTGGIARSASYDKESIEHDNAFAKNTSAAVTLGAETMVRGYCQQLVSLVSEQNSPGLTVEKSNIDKPMFVITGGTGKTVSHWIKQYCDELNLGFDVEYYPDLVLEGISHWFSLNN